MTLTKAWLAVVFACAVGCGGGKSTSTPCACDVTNGGAQQVVACGSSGCVGGQTADCDGSGHYTIGTACPTEGGDMAQSNSCGTPPGTFECGLLTCRYADQYCIGSQYCVDFNGDCPSCMSSAIHCGVGATPTCTGDAATGVHVACN